MFAVILTYAHVPPRIEPIEQSRVRKCCLTIVAAISLLFSTNLHAETRVALVVGNGAYKNVPPLPNPANDAASIAAVLRQSGFSTILTTDLTKAAMEEATIEFAKSARTADVAFFYYSGHAMQVGGVNYLAPVDLVLKDEADIRRMIRVDDIIKDLGQAKMLRVLVLDSCRDNPFADQLKRSVGGTRNLSLQSGLAKIDSPEGMIIGYSTQSGLVAEDGEGKNSPYTSALLRHLIEKEEIGTVFRRVSADVYEATGHRQLPELSLSLIGEYFLNGRPSLIALPAAIPPSPEERQRVYEQAANSGNTFAMVNLALIYQNGLGVNQDYNLAREWYEKAARLGDASAMRSMGNIYEEGIGVHKDREKAKQWYEEAAAVGDSTSMRTLGYLYEYGGFGLAKDYAHALEWYQRAAKAGDGAAMYSVGRFYQVGLSVNPDYQTARQWFAKAVAAGYKRAELNLYKIDHLPR